MARDAYLKKDIIYVENVQKVYKKILLEKKLSYKERLTHFLLETLEKRRLTFDLSVVFSILIQNVLPINDFLEINENFTRNNHPIKLSTYSEMKIEQ